MLSNLLIQLQIILRKSCVFIWHTYDYVHKLQLSYTVIQKEVFAHNSDLMNCGIINIIYLSVYMLNIFTIFSLHIFIIRRSLIVIKLDAIRVLSELLTASLNKP
jgi:hypothetical protein